MTQKELVIETLEAVLEWIETGMIDGAGFDDQQVAEQIKEALSLADRRE